MKAVVAGVVLFGVAIGGLMYVNARGAQYSWIVATVGYILALFLVQFLQARRTLRESARFNAVLALVVTGLVLIDTLVLHRGIFKDAGRSVEGLLYRAFVLAAAIGVPTAIVGSFLGLSVGRVRKSEQANRSPTATTR